MNSLHLDLHAIAIYVAAALLAGCDGSQASLSPEAIEKNAHIRTPESSSYQVLYRFTGGVNGERPFGSLINVDGTLYGTTVDGGSHKSGTFFSVTTTGTETLLYTFRGGTDGAFPTGGLVNVKGKLYGTTDEGGRFNNGTVFSITTTGTENVLHHFIGSGSDGRRPGAGLINVNGTLYGTTSSGGISHNAGTVFRITTSGQEKVLHSFDLVDGWDPEGSLINLDGRLYGTTMNGGRKSSNGYGTVFSITTNGVEKTLHRFGRGSDGANPAAGLIDVNGTLYGTTVSGGTTDGGTVYSITQKGTERVVYSFGGGSDGTQPYVSLVNAGGILYGGTHSGGANSVGTVFSVTTTGVENVLHSFGAGSKDGAIPLASLIDVKGTLYGSTFEGGLRCRRRHLSCGTIFALTP